jgi:hypothetical protein
MYKILHSVSSPTFKKRGKDWEQLDRGLVKYILMYLYKEEKEIYRYMYVCVLMHWKILEKLIENQNSLSLVSA